MKVLYSWLKDYTDYQGSAEEAAVLLTEHSYEVEKMEKIGKETVLDIDVLANRTLDSLSHIGVAQELAAVADAGFELPPVELREVGVSSDDVLTVTIDEMELCPRYISRVIRDVSVKDSPKWLQDRLEVLGQRSVNTIVDATNYVMLEYGQPLHAFDFDKLEGATIAVRSARKGETMTTLDGEDVELTDEMLIIADANDPLAIAGIKGGTKAAINSETTTIVLESAAFDSVSVRRTARAIGIQTESSRRFEAGVDLIRPQVAIDRVAQLIVEVAGGSVAPGRVDVGREPEASAEIVVRPEEVQRLLGVEIDLKTMASFMRRLLFGWQEEAGFLVVTPPSFRQDIRTVPDVIEEIARLYGYNQIPSTPPLAHLSPLEQRQDYDVELLLRQTLIGLGMVEVRNYSFVSEKENEVNGNDGATVLIENALSSDLAFLRAGLLSGILRTVSRNAKNREYFRLFEVGNVFAQDADKLLPKEDTHVGGAFVHGAGGDDLFFESKGVLESFLQQIGIVSYHFDASANELSYAIPGRSADIVADETRIGFIAEIDMQTRAAFDIGASVVVFEIDFSALTDEIEGAHAYRSFSRYPTVVRDVAVLVPQDVRVSHVLNAIESSGAEWITDVDLFDFYDGDEMGELQKSLAFHIIYQSDTKTLTDEEVNKEHKKVITVLTSEGWEVR